MKPVQSISWGIYGGSGVDAVSYRGSSLVAPFSTDVDLLVRARVVVYVPLKGGRDLGYCALGIRRVVVPRARVRLPWAGDMDFAVRVVESEELVRQGGDRVLLVVDADEVGDFGVEQARPRRVPDAWRAVGDRLHVDAWEIEGEEHCVEFSKRAT